MNAAQAKSMNKLFVANVRRFVERAKGNADEVVREVLFDLSAAICLRTPVDVGRLRSNWQFGTNDIPSGVLDSTDDATPRLQAQASIAKAGNIHYIVNNLPYAPVIEYGMYPGDGPKTSGGYSIQAPAGMVRVTVVEYKQYLDKAVQSLGRE